MLQQLSNKLAGLNVFCATADAAQRQRTFLSRPRIGVADYDCFSPVSPSLLLDVIHTVQCGRTKDEHKKKSFSFIVYLIQVNLVVF